MPPKSHNSDPIYISSTNQQKENVILARVIFPDETEEMAQSDIDELSMLVKTAGGNVSGIITQHRSAPDSAFFIGRGKLEEIKNLLIETDAKTVIFDHDIKPGQMRNIGKVIGEEIKVIDRTAVILDIFAKHARTPESKTQVELAQLEYLLPRLSGMWKHLERQYGGIGMRGPGEKQLESDRRIIKRRISLLKEKLIKIEKERETQGKRRDNLFRVALVGYTNSGKSSLLNCLTKSNARVANALFSTLDAMTRKMSAPQRGIIITDTVGFIKKLPHSLIESFKSTLSEVKNADVVLIVADASHPAVDEHLNVVYSVLDELGYTGENILVMNKIDLLTQEEQQRILRQYPSAKLTSALKGTGIEYLREFLISYAKRNYGKI